MDQISYLLAVQRTAELRREAAAASRARSVATGPSLWHRAAAALAERLHVPQPTRSTAACATC